MANISETNTKIEISPLILNNGTKTIEHGEEEDTYAAYTMQLITSCALPLVMKATSEMGVFQIIHANTGSNNGLSSEEIANMINTQNPDAPCMLDRMLQLLATYYVVKCTVVTTTNGCPERRYSPSPVTKFLVPHDDDKVSMAAYLNSCVDKVSLQCWGKIKEAVLEGGIPFNIIHGMNIFEYLSVDTRYNEIFNKGMYQTSTLGLKRIIEKYKGFENIKQLVDVGGGLGQSLRIITSRYPSIKGINFDLPHVIVNAPPCPGVYHVCGDMFESVPRGDAIFMKWILHDWSDDDCLKVLKNCYMALPENGKVIVVETIITDEPASTHSGRTISQQDVAMMICSPGGKERNRQEFESLAKAAGFATINLVCYVYTFWVMEFLK